MNQKKKPFYLDSEAPFTVNQYDSLDRLNELYEQYSDLPSELRDHAKELIGDLFSSEDDLWRTPMMSCFYPKLILMKKLGSYWLDQGLIAVPKELENYIDEDALGRDIRLDGQVIYVSDGCFMR